MTSFRSLALTGRSSLASDAPAMSLSVSDAFGSMIVLASWMLSAKASAASAPFSSLRPTLSAFVNHERPSGST
ncbi:hypothetical protein BE04_32275 [Sorangium cellulosum]|uniref:Uncharacterized protein n=1 Tax=Sorangium cellulosum TaxID=56 RepID=A0A150PLL1_SORCE|nr:hypothetical protein BE04_32275 [Sorangium cellulosum]